MSDRIHPSAIVGEHVRVGSGTTIGPFAVITGPVEIGDDTWIGAGVVIGATPEIRGIAHPADGVAHPADGVAGAHGVRIGSRTIIREYAQVHGGSAAPTVVGDDAFIMNQAYIAHDGHLEDGVTLASSVLLAGHVRIGAGANLGLGTSVHQRRSVGAGAMVGMGSVVTRDIPMYAKAYGSPAKVHGANVVGLQRSGVADELAEALQRAYAAGDVAASDRLGRELHEALGRARP